MTVLEAMREGLPVVLTETTGLAPAVRAANAGIVVDGSPAAISDAVGRLLSDEALRATYGKNARELVEGSFSIEAITRRLEETYLNLALS
jgi:glycosyltransferase involved in cell wall biosynthesis